MGFQDCTRLGGRIVCCCCVGLCINMQPLLCAIMQARVDHLLTFLSNVHACRLWCCPCSMCPQRLAFYGAGDCSGNLYTAQQGHRGWDRSVGHKLLLQYYAVLCNSTSHIPRWSKV